MAATDRARWGRIGAHESWARTPDRSARTAPGRRAAAERFERQVDPDGVLDPAERSRRAEHARRAHFLRMAEKSVASRRAKAGLTTCPCGRPTTGATCSECDENGSAA